MIPGFVGNAARVFQDSSVHDAAVYWTGQCNSELRPDTLVI